MPECNTTLYFIRHGYSCANYKKETYGIFADLISDPALSNAGAQDIVKNAYIFRDEPTYIFCSELLRSMQTAIQLFPGNSPIYVVPYVSETGFGPANSAKIPSVQKKILGVDSKRIIYTYLGETKSSRLSNDELDRRFRKFGKSSPDIDNFLRWLSMTGITVNKNNVSIAVISHSNFMKKFMVEKNIIDRNTEKPRNGSIIKLTLCKSEMTIKGRKLDNLKIYTNKCYNIQKSNGICPVIIHEGNDIPKKGRDFSNC